MKNLILISILGLFFFTSCGPSELTFADPFEYEPFDYMEEHSESFIDDIYAPIYRDPYWSLYFEKRRLLNHIRYWNKHKY